MMSAKSRWGLIKDLHIVSRENLDNILCNFFNYPIDLLILLSLPLRCSWKSSLVFKIIGRCLRVADWVTILFKFSDGWFSLSSFLGKITARACFLGSGLKLIFHWNAHDHLNSLLIE